MSDLDRPPLTPADKRWAVLAAEMPFEQLPALRRQAEGWRNGVGGTVTVLTGVLLVRGRTDIGGLSTGWRYTATLLLLLAFTALLCGLVLTTRVAHGAPGATIHAESHALRDWTEAQVRVGGRLLRLAVTLSVAGLGLVVVAMAVTWLGPAS